MDESERHELIPIDPDLTASARTEPAPGRRRPTHRRDRRAPPDVLAVIAIGGALGASARYGIEKAVTIPPGGFPWATFWINVTGALALGVFLVVVVERFPPSRYLRPFVATGFLGGYTTFSTFVVEADLLLKDGHAAVAVIYVVASLVVGIAASWIGIAAGRLLPPRPRHPEVS